MAGNPQIVVEYVAKTADLVSGLNKTEAAAKSSGSKIKSMGKVALAAAGAAGIGALVSTLKIGIDEYTEAAKVGAQTEAVIKSTGKSANVSAKHVDDLAGSLMEKSGVDDEVIASGENMLLTFTNIRNEAGRGNKIFDQTTQTLLDMSVATGQDMPKAAVMLGKAINDPIKGVSALSRVGVTFTEAQKKQIKALVDAGDTMGAQKIILGELRKEFGGSAEAAGKTLPGQINILKQSFNNLAGDLVGTFMPAITKVARFFIKHKDLTKALVIGILAVAAAVVVMNIALTVTAVVASPIAAIVLAIVAAVAALIVVGWLLYKNWGKITKAFGDAMNWVKRQALGVLNWLKAHWPEIVGILAGPFGIAAVAIYRNWGKITDAARSALAAVRAILSGFNSWLAGMAATIAGWAGKIAGAFGKLDDPVRAGVNAIKSLLGSLPAFILGLVHKVTGAASSLANAIKAPINAVLRAWNSLEFRVPKITLPKIKVLGKKIGGGSFGGWSFPFPDIPLLAKGGIVTGPTLAMVGERGPEAVIPLDSSGALGPLSVRVFIGDTELKGMVRAEVRDENNRLAQTLLAGLR